MYSLLEARNQNYRKKEGGGFNYYPYSVTFTNELSPLQNIQSPTDSTYDFPIEYLVPANGSIRYEKDHLFVKDDTSSSSRNYAVAFVDITDCAFEQVELFPLQKSSSVWVGWTFLTELPAVGEQVSYASGYASFVWAEESVTVDIPADAKYLVVWYQDGWEERELYRPVSIIFINTTAGCNHDLLAYTVTVVPTAFSVGAKTAHCNNCGADIVAEIAKTDVDLITRTSDLTNDNTNMKLWYNSVPLARLTCDGNHFYPTEESPEGKSLYVEFSMLINETLDLPTKNGKAWFIPAAISSNSLVSSTISNPFYIHIDENDSYYCPFVGGIEPGFEVESFYGGSVASERFVDGSVYYAMDDYYGWHRFGVQYTQSTRVVNGNVEYTMQVSLYIDGVRVMSEVSSSWKVENLLYTAELRNGELVYSDNSNSDRIVSAAILQYFIPENDTMYVPMADVYITCGDGFVVDVMPVVNPETETSYIKGIEFNTTTHFEREEN